MSGAMATAGIAIAGASAAASYSASKKQSDAMKKQAKAASQPQVSRHIPYGNEYIARVMPYVLKEAQAIYETRSQGYGRQPGNFGEIAKMLQGIPSNYSGVEGHDLQYQNPQDPRFAQMRDNINKDPFTEGSAPQGSQRNPFDF